MAARITSIADGPRPTGAETPFLSKLVWILLFYGRQAKRKIFRCGFAVIVP